MEEMTMNETGGSGDGVSLRKLEANRNNALKSTGPKTARGKAVVRMNAFKHGVFSKGVVVQGLQIRERSKEFQQLRERLWDELAPVGVVEELLVDRIVTTHWRMRRALTAEAGEIALSVDGGHWQRKKKGPQRFWSLFNGLSDTLTEMEQSASGLSYLIQVLKELQEQVTRDGEVTEAALERFRSGFGAMGNSLTRELEGLRKELLAHPGGSSAEALKGEIQRAILGRIEGRLNLYRLMSEECEDREEREEAARQAAEVLPSPEVVDRIQRYEGKLERQLYRAMNQLERLQRRRSGEAVPPPITIVS